MTCPICFFRDSYQRSLKVKTFNESRFEIKLAKYKKLYIDEIHLMNSLRDCSCYEEYNNDSLVLWLDEFLFELKQSVVKINDAFDQILETYLKYITENQRSSLNHLFSFLENNKLTDRTADASQLVKILFRARWKGEYDSNDIKEYFHIPFSLRSLVGSQRFSISGLPLLYLGSSVLTVEKELEGNDEQLNYSAFLPSYSAICQFKIFSLTNSINDLIENSLPGLLEAECSVLYSGFKLRFLKEIQANILLQICTFPTDSKQSFIPEYVIPQMLTSALQQNDFHGLSFPSTKCFDDLKDNHSFSSHHLNVVLFTEYDVNNDHDLGLLNRFFTYVENKKPYVTCDDVLAEINKVVEINKNNNINNTDYVMPLCRIKLQMEYLEQSMIDGIKYYDTQTGKIELGLYMKMVEDMHKIVTERVAYKSLKRTKNSWILLLRRLF